MSDPIYDATSFWELLERRVDQSADQVMLIDVDDRRVTFGEFKAWAERVAAGFAAMGIGEGSPVTWQLPTRIETIVASFALSRLGAVQNPIIHIYGAREVGFCIKQTNAALVLHPGNWNGTDFGQVIADVVADMDNPPQIMTAYDQLPEGDPADLPPAPTGQGEPIRWLYYTSGTTSDPKGAKHTDATLMAGGIGLAKALDMSSSDVGSIAFPYAHIGGPDYMVTMLASGFPAVLVEKFVLDDAIAAFAKHGVTMAGGSTAFYTMFLNEQRKQPDSPIIPSLRLLSGGGAPKPPEVYYEVKDEMHIPVCHGYGMTECPMIAQGGPHDTDEQLATTEGHSVFGCDVTVLREDGSEAAAGEVGEIRLSGPMVFKGYLDADLDAAAFDEAGRFRSGDLGIKHADGHITLTGRLKDVIIRKGENISAKEVEDVLYTHPKVGAVGVVGLPDRDRGERVCAVIEPAPGAEPLTFEEMVAHCEAAGLMKQKTPEQLETRDNLPRNATMKILKFKLRDELAAQPWP